MIPPIGIVTMVMYYQNIVTLFHNLIEYKNNDKVVTHKETDVDFFSKKLWRRYILITDPLE